MSIMDHQPKYAKLRAWRMNREVQMCLERLRRSRLRDLIPRMPYKGELYNWKPITAFREQDGAHDAN